MSWVAEKWVSRGKKMNSPAVKKQTGPAVKKQTGF
jgi:hypothetical protein